MKAALASVAIAILFCPGALAKAGQSTTHENFDELSRRASAALQAKPAEAANLYRQALALKPSWAEGWFYLAASLYQLNQYDQSQKAFQRAATLAQDNGTVWAFLGLCEYRMSDYGQALKDIEKGEALGLGNDPRFISTIRDRAADIRIRSADFGAAMEQLGPLARAGDDSAATIEAFGVSALRMPYPAGKIPPEKRAFVQLAGRAAWAFSAQRAEDAGNCFSS